MPHRVGVRIVRLANFVTPISGGLRTTLNALGEGYVAAGHDAVLVVPGERDSEELTTAGRIVSVKGIPVPWMGGYRVLLGRRRLARLLAAWSRAASRCPIRSRCGGPDGGPGRTACRP